MGLMDGAASGLATRLISGGYTPPEAFCLAQAAYIKERKRAEVVPPSVIDGKQATAEINQTLRNLLNSPMGVEAHRQRIILWEKVFGRGSWHEPVDPSEIYGQASGPERIFTHATTGNEGNFEAKHADLVMETASKRLLQRVHDAGRHPVPGSETGSLMTLAEARRNGDDRFNTDVDKVDCWVYLAEVTTIEQP